MKRTKFKVVVAALVLLALLGAAISACGGSDADVASENLSKEAEQFHVERRIVFYNAITDKIMLVIEGDCSIETPEGLRKLEVTCKSSDQAYFKDYLGLSDNVTYIVQQLHTLHVSTSRYKVIFKPSTLIPDFEIP